MIQKWFQEHWLLALALILGIIALISITVATLLFPPITTFFIGLGLVGFHPFAIIAGFPPVYAALTCGLISAFVTWSAVALAKVFYEAGVGIHKWYLILFKQQIPPKPPTADSQNTITLGGSSGLALTMMQQAAAPCTNINLPPSTEDEEPQVLDKSLPGRLESVSIGTSHSETQTILESVPAETSHSETQTILR